MYQASSYVSACQFHLLRAGSYTDGKVLHQPAKAATHRRANLAAPPRTGGEAFPLKSTGLCNCWTSANGGPPVKAERVGWLNTSHSTSAAARYCPAGLKRGCSADDVQLPLETPWRRRKARVVTSGPHRRPGYLKGRSGPRLVGSLFL